MSENSKYESKYHVGLIIFLLFRSLQGENEESDNMKGSKSEDSMACSESSGAEDNATGIFLSSNTKKQ